LLKTVIQASIRAELFVRPKIIHTEPFVNIFFSLDEKQTELKIITTKTVDEIRHKSTK
jgi:hypothetical protein